MSQLTCAGCESRPFGKGEGMEDIHRVYRFDALTFDDVQCRLFAQRNADGDCYGPFTIKQ